MFIDYNQYDDDRGGDRAIVGGHVRAIIRKEDDDSDRLWVKVDPLITAEELPPSLRSADRMGRGAQLSELWLLEGCPELILPTAIHRTFVAWIKGTPVIQQYENIIDEIVYVDRSGNWAARSIDLRHRLPTEPCKMP
jgi:hypothetical protein